MVKTNVMKATVTVATVSADQKCSFNLSNGKAPVTSSMWCSCVWKEDYKDRTLAREMKEIARQEKYTLAELVTPTETQLAFGPNGRRTPDEWKSTAALNTARKRFRQKLTKSVEGKMECVKLELTRLNRGLELQEYWDKSRHDARVTALDKIDENLKVSPIDVKDFYAPAWDKKYKRAFTGRQWTSCMTDRDCGTYGHCQFIHMYERPSRMFLGWGSTIDHINDAVCVKYQSQMVRNKQPKYYYNESAETLVAPGQLFYNRSAEDYVGTGGRSWALMKPSALF